VWKRPPRKACSLPSASDSLLFELQDCMRKQCLLDCMGRMRTYLTVHG
jgi:hypothetical protein